MNATADERTQAWMLIDRERGRQDHKWGVQNHGAPIWSLILGEEIGEISEAYLDLIFNGGKPDIEPEKLAKLRKAYMTELVQAAAVLVAWIECEIRREANLSLDELERRSYVSARYVTLRNPKTGEHHQINAKAKDVIRTLQAADWILLESGLAEYNTSE